jgi:hypothetical protein
MIRKVLLISLFLLMLPALIHAQGPQNKPFGLGLALGEPTGITGKYWFNRKNTLQFAAGWGYWPHHGGAIYCDYLYNVFTILRAKKVPFNLLFYMGLGGKLGIWDDYWHRDHYYDSGVSLGLRIPFGVTMVFVKGPFDVFLEVVPGMAFIHPHPFWFDLDACIGGRFYF